ncbi:MAG: lipopolysaccharide biosynthesis protein [Deltaproteobacteria bacterium]|nr:lipopolysaccharide biosynthesis protein [Deltaproteobacteria bacterium]
MALSSITPRDRLQRLADLGRRTLRYWWLIAVFAVVGGGLSFAFVMFKARSYQSWSTLFYQERIQSNLLSANRDETVMRNIGDKYRELLIARPQLEQIVGDPALNPFPKERDLDIAIDKLRPLIKLEPRGGNAFRIVYTDADPNRAKAVTEKLTKMLQDKDEALRNETARATVEFVLAQKEESAKELRKRELLLAEFLAKHPEFVQDTNAPSEGASMRAIRNASKAGATTGNNRLYALERQKQRIQARLDAPPDAPAIRIAAPPTPERIAAEAEVGEAQREVAAAKRELEDALSKFTDKHPTAIAAQTHVAAAQQRLRHAQAAVPPDTETTVAPATPQDRAKLQKELAQLENQINELQHGKGAAPSTDTSTDWVVQLETQYTNLRRDVNEQREQVNSLASSVFRAQMDANQKLAEAGGRLSVVDPAFKPVRPSGPGKTIFMIAGMVLFLSLGLSLAVGLAVIDDRLYRRVDLDQLGIAVLAVIPPASPVARRKRRKPAQEDVG